jgi:outer membrane protein assembly factor BamB
MLKARLLAAALLAVPLSVSADDWPQWRGPARDGVSKEKGLLKSWPKEGPALAWTFEEAGLGYSGYAVVGNVLYSMGAVDDKNGDKEFTFALDTKTGTQLWKTDFGQYYPNGWGGGPRSTPTVDGEHIYVLGGRGTVACLKAKDGAIVWQKNFTKDFEGKQQKIWGYSESLLVDGDHVIGMPGGPKGAVVALNKKTGETVWRSTDLKDEAAYSSFVVATIGGVKQYIGLTAAGTVGIAAADGKLLWSDKLGANNIAVIPTPIVEANLVYVTSNYPDGTSGQLKITGDGMTGFKAERAYETTKILKNHHGGVVKVGNLLYGFNGNQRGEWVAVEFKTGELKWKEEDKTSLDKGSIFAADGSLYCYGQSSGKCIKIAASEEGWKAEGTLTIPKKASIRSKQGGIWTHPVVANGKLYLRDQNLIFAFDVAEKK